MQGSGAAATRASGAASTRPDVSPQLQVGDVVCFREGTEFAQRDSIRDIPGVVSEIRDDKAFIEFLSIGKKSLYWLNSPGMREITILKNNDFVLGSTFVQLKNLSSEYAEFEMGYAMVIRMISTSVYTVYPRGTDTRMIPVYSFQMKTLSNERINEITWPSLEKIQLFSSLMRGALRNIGEISSRPPSAPLSAEIMENYRVHAEYVSSLYHNKAILFDFLGMAGDEYSYADCAATNVQRPCFRALDGVNSIGYVRTNYRLHNLMNGCCGHIVCSHPEGNTVSFQPFNLRGVVMEVIYNRVTAIENARTFVDEPFVGCIAVVSGLNHPFDIFNGKTVLVLQTHFSDSTLVVYCTHVQAGSSDMVLMKVPPWCLTRQDQFMGRDYPRCIMKALEMYSAFHDVVVCIPQVEANLKHAQDFLNMTSNTRAMLSPVIETRGMSGLRGTGRMLMEAIKKAEETEAECVKDIQEMKTTLSVLYPEEPFNVGDQVLCRGYDFQVPGVVRAVVFSFYCVEFTHNLDEDGVSGLMFSGRDLTRMEVRPQPPTFRFRSMQEMEGMPADTPRIVPEEGVEPTSPTSTPRLSQGQLKKLKQRRAKERKRETTEFVTSVLDLIVTNAVDMGGVRAAEKCVDTDISRIIQSLESVLVSCSEEITREADDILRRQHGECMRILDEVVDTIVDDSFPDLIKSLFEIVVAAYVNERDYVREAAAGRNRIFVNELFFAANPGIAALLSSNVEGVECFLCMEKVDVLDNTVSTVMCCGHYSLLCPSCRPLIVSSHNDNPPPAGHVFSESYTHHVTVLAQNLRAVFRSDLE